MKRLLSVLLALCLLVGAMPLAYAEDGRDVDAGAVETDGVESPAPEDNAPIEVGTEEELQAAIDAAEDGDIIVISERLTISWPDTCIGTDDKTVVLQFNNNGYLCISASSTTLKNLIFQGQGSSPEYVIWASIGTELYMDNVTITGFTCNIAPFDNLGNSYVSNCTFTNNSGKQAGHILNEQYGTLKVNNSIFSGGNSDGCGGAIKCDGESIISGSKFYNNSAVIGGAIYTQGDTTITDCSIIGNNALKAGGINCGYDGGTTTITDCEIYGNHASSFADDISNLSIMILQYTKDIEEVYTSTDRVPYNWMKDTSVTRDGIEESIIYPTPIMGDYNNLGGYHLKMVFEDELPEEKEPEETDPSPVDPPAEPDTQQQEPGDSQEPQPPTEPDDKHEPPTEPGDGDTDTGAETPQEPPTSPSEGDNDSGNDYTPPAHWWPSTPSTPSTRPAPKEEDIPDNDTPLVDAPFLTCGSAVIDTSQSVVLAGYGDGLLHEDDPLTRAQAAQIIYRLLTEESAGQLRTLQNAFTDCPSAAWYNEAVSTIANAGIVVGCGNGLYCPNDNLTWAQALTILTRFVEAQEYDLQHITYDGWALQAVQTAAALGWIEDSADLSVNAIITRGDFVELFNGVLEMY